MFLHCHEPAHLNAEPPPPPISNIHSLETDPEPVNNAAHWGAMEPLITQVLFLKWQRKDSTVGFLWMGWGGCFLASNKNFPVKWSPSSSAFLVSDTFFWWVFTLMLLRLFGCQPHASLGFFLGGGAAPCNMMDWTKCVQSHRFLLLLSDIWGLCRTGASFLPKARAFLCGYLQTVCGGWEREGRTDWGNLALFIFKVGGRTRRRAVREMGVWDGKGR